MSPGPLLARPLTWTVVLVLALVLRLGPLPALVAWVMVAGTVVVRARRWSGRPTIALAVVCGVLSVAGHVYLVSLPPYHNGIGDMGLIMLGWIGLTAAAWSSQPPRRTARTA